MELDDPFLSAHDGAHGALRLYLQGLLFARAGNRNAALARAEELVERTPGLSSDRWQGEPGDADGGRLLGARLARSLRGYARSRAERDREALTTLQALPEGAREERIRRSPLAFGALERFLRARLLARTGDAEAALRWYGSFAGGSPLELVWLAPSHLARARLYEEMGRTDSAAAHYREALALWDRPDERFAPTLRRARERLTALERP